ncbi:MAG: SPOR domain-containing protein [Ignavibacteriae bacterium]|nr:SPOR domain-containing protein [Ignavibacteriota bacterium]
MKRSLMTLLLLPLLVLSAVGQSGTPDIRALVARVNAGAADEVREQLSTLLTDHPNDPGVLYLQALLTREGADAVRTYQSIVDNFPKSEWADDALFKVYQFYYALGLYRTADLKMGQLKAEYPSSQYASAQPQAQTDAPEPASTRPADVTPAETVPAETKPAETPTELPKAGLPPPADQVRPVETKNEPAAQDPAPSGTDTAIPVRFSLQVGAFTVHANAVTAKNKYEGLGYTAEMISKVRDTKSLFIVMVGSYGTYDEAKAAAAQLKRKTGVSAMVVSR